MKNKYQLDEDQQRVLEETRVYLEDAARRLGRVDWRTAAAGAFLGAIVTAVLPPDQVREMLMMLMMLGRSLAHLLGHPFPTLPSG